MIHNILFTSDAAANIPLIRVRRSVSNVPLPFVVEQFNVETLKYTIISRSEKQEHATSIAKMVVAETYVTPVQFDSGWENHSLGTIKRESEDGFTSFIRAMNENIFQLEIYAPNKWVPVYEKLFTDLLTAQKTDWEFFNGADLGAAA